VTSHVDSDSRYGERKRNLQGQTFVVAAALAALEAFVGVAFAAVGALGVAVVFVGLPCVFGWVLRVWFLPR
jgi:hypothetical protein